MTAADRPSVTDDARADEVPRLSIEDGYLVARVDRCTCEPHYGAHEIHCGIVDHHRLDNLPGWPGRAETTTATDEDAEAAVIDALGQSPFAHHEVIPSGETASTLYITHDDEWSELASLIVQMLASRGLLATARTRPTREQIIDALVMSPLSDTAGTDLRPFEQTADAVLALLNEEAGR